MTFTLKRLVGGVAFAAFAAVSAPAMAGQPLDLRYDLYIAGFKVFEIGLSGEISAKGFTSSASMRPKGFGSFFSDDETEMRAAGPVASGKPAPRTFEMQLKDDRRFSVSWSADTPLKTVRSRPLSEEREKAVNSALKGPLADPLTTVMRLAMSSDGSKCNLSQRVYNGKEVYELALSPAGEANMDGDGAYAGPAKRCKLSYRTIAGFSEKTMRKNRKSPPDITLLIAPVKTGGGKPLTLIVGASGSIDGRSFKARLAKGSLAGAPLQARSP